MASRFQPQKQTTPAAPSGGSDHLIRPLQDRSRDRQAEGLRSLEVDHQLERGRLLDGQVSGLGPFNIRSTKYAARP